jgi:uncharacterized protein (TIGR04255 family)
MSGTTLPKFNNPPVVEVALSISFEPLERFRSAHAGRLWDRIRDQFPATEDQPELRAATEEPGAPALPPRLELMERPRIRTWFQNSDGTQLLQIQHNRIAYNWKRGPDSQPYPSYEAVEGRFRELLPIWMDFVGRENLGRIVTTQAEVTYVNHIREPHKSVGRVVTLWRGLEGSAFLPPVEDVRFAARYAITDDANQMIGRLSADLQAAYLTSDRSELLNLNLIARGKPRSPDIDGAIAFLRLGHEWIVRGFAEITTPEMHAKWNRTQ